MSVSPKIHRQVLELISSDEIAMQIYRDAIAHIGAHNEKLDLTPYADLPQGVFGEAAADMHTDVEFRLGIYENRVDTVTSDLLDDMEDLLTAEFDLKAFYTVRNNQAAIEASNQRLKKLAQLIDEYQEGESEHTTWFVDRQDLELVRLLPFHEAQKHYEAKALEVGVFEKVVLEYALTAHSFIENTDLHAAMIVMYLSEDPRRIDDPTHTMYTRAMQHEIKNSAELTKILYALYPTLKDEPQNNNGHDPVKAAPRLN